MKKETFYILCKILYWVSMACACVLLIWTGINLSNEVIDFPYWTALFFSLVFIVFGVVIKEIGIDALNED